MNYGINISLNNLVSGPAQLIVNSLQGIDKASSAISKSVQSVGVSLRNTFSSFSSVSQQARQQIVGLRTELAEMRDFQASLTIGIDDSLIQQVETEIIRLQSEINRLSQPTSLRVTASNSINQASQSINRLRDSIRLESAQASLSQRQNDAFQRSLAQFPQNIGDSARSVNRLRQELATLMSIRDSLDINVNDSQIRSANKQIQQLEQQIAKVENRRIGGGLFGGVAKDMLVGNLAFAGIQAGIDGIRNSFKNAMDLEQTKINFSVFAQNKALASAQASGAKYNEQDVRAYANNQANTTVQDLNKYADATSFENGDLLRIGGKMSAYLQQADIIKKVKMLGDISGGSFDKLSGLENAYAQIKSKGTLQGQELNQLNDSGAYGIREALAKVKGVSVSEIAKLIEDRKVSFEDVDKALMSMTQKGGAFLGLMDAQSKSTFGRLSTLIGGIKSQFSEFVMTNSFPVFNRMIDLTQVAFDNLSILSKPFANLYQSIQPAINGVKNLWNAIAGGDSATSVIKATFGTIGGIVNWISGGIAVLSNAFEYLTSSIFGKVVIGGFAIYKTIGLITMAMSALRIAALSNPFTAILVAIPLLISGIQMLWENSETFRGVMTGAWEAIKETWGQLSSFFMGIFEITKSVFVSFSSWILGFWKGVRSIWSSSLLWFSQFVDTLSNVFSIAGANISNFFTPVLSIWSKIKQSLGEILDWIKDKLSSVFEVVGKLFNMLPQVKVAKFGIKISQDAIGKAGELAKSISDKFKSGYNIGVQAVSPKIQGQKSQKSQKNGIEAILDNGSKNLQSKDKTLADKAKVNESITGSKPTTINITFAGAITGVQNLTQQVASDFDIKARATEIGDVVTDYIIRRIGSSVAIAGQ